MFAQYKQSFAGRLDQLVTVSSILLWIIVIYYASTQLMPRAQFGVAFLGGILLIYVFDEVRKRLDTDGPIDRIDKIHIALLTISGIVTLVTCVYLFVEFEALYMTRVGYAYSHEYAIAAVFTLVMVYLTWMAFGTTFLVVLLGGILYGYFGYMVPGILGHGGLSHTRLLQILVTEIEGFFGFLTRLVAAWIALFLLYAGLLEAYGAFDLIFRLAAKAGQYIDSGVAQTAVIGSAIIGSINGSQTANAGMTGAFTIPLMKKNGIKGSTAGGIEAVASTSGQVLPPVMGAGAFVMASLLGISYVDVLIAGLLPAAILVISIVVAVHYTSITQLDEAVKMDEIEGTLSRSRKVSEAFRFGIPFAILIWALGIAQYTVMTAALYTATSMVITGVSFPILEVLYRTRNISKVKDQVFSSFWDTVFGFKRGAIVTAPIAIILAAINGVVDILVTTGVPSIVTLALMSLSGGVLLIAAILAMIICILLGLGMPTTAAYTVVALLVAPTLIHSFLLPDLAAHYFVFYGAILAGLTPPIATCAAVASGIADADFWETTFEAIKIAAPLFILPFGFIYHPYMVDGVFDFQTILLGGIVLIGAVGMIWGINYPFIYRRSVRAIFRSGYVVFGVIAMVHWSRTIQLVAIGALLVLLFVQKSARFADVGILQPPDGRPPTAIDENPRPSSDVGNPDSKDE